MGGAPPREPTRDANVKLVALGVCAVLLFPALARAEDPGTGFWGGIDVGYGALKRSRSVTGSASDNNLAMSFRGGYAWHPQLLFGIELGGWSLEATDYNGVDPSKGEAIETFLALAQYYPAPGSPWFLKGGLGGAKYWTNHAGEKSGSGPAAMLGLGRDFRVAERWNVTAAADYSWGRLDGLNSPPGVTQDERYRALTFRIGLAYR